MDDNFNRQIVKQKQESFHVSIRRNKMEETFKNKRYAVLQQNQQNSIYLHTLDQLNTVIPHQLINAYQFNQLNELTQSLEQLTNIIRQYAHQADAYKNNLDQDNYEAVEKCVSDFFLNNQEVIQIIVQICGLQFNEQEIEGFIPYDKQYYQQLILCKYAFLFFSNLAYFNSEDIIKNLADREMSNYVVKSLFKKLDKKLILSNPEISEDILSNLQQYFINLICDVHIGDNKSKEICYDFLCSDYPLHMKTISGKINVKRAINQKQEQIRFINCLLHKGYIRDLEHYQVNVIYFIQLANQILLEYQNHPKLTNLQAIQILNKLSLHHDSLLIVSTKCIWNNLIELMDDIQLYSSVVTLFGNLAASEDVMVSNRVVITLVDYGILDPVSRQISQQINPKILKQTMIMLDNMLSAQSNQYCDKFVNNILPSIIKQFKMYLEIQQPVDEIAHQLTHMIINIRRNDCFTLVNIMQIIETEIFELLTESLDYQSVLVMDYLKSLVSFRDIDKLIAIEILRRLQMCNYLNRITIACNKLPPYYHDIMEENLKEFSEMIDYWEDINESKERDFQMNTEEPQNIE